MKKHSSILWVWKPKLGTQCVRLSLDEPTYDYRMKADPWEGDQDMSTLVFVKTVSRFLGESAKALHKITWPEARRITVEKLAYEESHLIRYKERKIGLILWVWSLDLVIDFVCFSLDGPTYKRGWESKGGDDFVCVKAASRLLGESAKDLLKITKAEAWRITSEKIYE